MRPGGGGVVESVVGKLGTGSPHPCSLSDDQVIRD